MTDTTLNATTDITHHEEHDEHHDPMGAKLGMWLFLFSEVLLFTGLFIWYGTYVYYFRAGFQEAAEELNVLLGGFNTLVLLTSSLTVAMSITAIQRNERIRAFCLLVFSLACGFVFLGVKYVEWTTKFHHGIYPKSEHLAEMGNAFTLFFGMYFTLTGLHALHVIIGMGLLATVTWMVWTGRQHGEDFAWLENSGLYWHLVDLIWIYLFPLLYLVA